MMHEQFPVQVRRHLVETANEIPADGALDAVLRLTAVKPQQRPWLIRLRWLVSPVAPYGNAVLRYGLVAAALLLALAAVAILAGGSSPGGKTMFEGRWRSIDPPDNSTQTLVVSSGLTPDIHFEDAFSSGCSDNGDTSTLFLADGPGQIKGDRLDVYFPTGGCVTWQVDSFYISLEYQSATDTLLQGDLVWHRLP